MKPRYRITETSSMETDQPPLFLIEKRTNFSKITKHYWVVQEVLYSRESAERLLTVYNNGT